MLVVRVELHSAVTGRITTLGQTVIANVGGTEERGNYIVGVCRKGQSLATALSKPIRRGEVKDYPRLSYNMWRLVIRALLSAFPEEKRNGK